VQYPADAGVRNATTLTEAQREHQAIGPRDIINRLTNQSKECPDEKFALVGYSQGGLVVYGAAPLIKAKPELASKVLAVVFYGAGNGSSLVLPSSTLLANCAPHDMVSHARWPMISMFKILIVSLQACKEVDPISNQYGHVSYNDKGSVWHDRSSQFIISAFNGKPLGPKLAKSPTGPL
jgi:hypothetical protein